MSAAENPNDIHEQSLTRNERLALAITGLVGTMPAFYLFTLLAFCSLPATLNLVGVLPRGVLPHWLLSASLITLIAWLSSNFIQLVLLPLLMVGQNLQGRHSELRAEHAYQTTVKAEQEVATMQAKLDTLMVRLEDAHDKLNQTHRKLDAAQGMPPRDRG